MCNIPLHLTWEDIKKHEFIQFLRPFVKTGDFTLSSGRKSNVYIDCKSVLLNPQGLSLATGLVSNLIGREVEAVCGVELGVVPLVVSTALSLSIPALIIRKSKKQHGLLAKIEGLNNVKPNSGVVLLEDVVTTGQTLAKAIDTLEQAGFVVLDVLTLVDRGEGGRKTLANKGYDLKTIVTKTELLGGENA